MVCLSIKAVFHKFYLVHSWFFPFATEDTTLTHCFQSFLKFPKLYSPRGCSNILLTWKNVFVVCAHTQICGHSTSLGVLYYKKRFLPEQLFPVKPSTQIHLYFPISSIHVEPAVHGFDKHSSISY